MYAIIDNGGKQYRVAPGEVVQIERLASEKGDEVVLDKVLLVQKEKEQIVGNPYVNGAKVIASVEADGKKKKVMVFQQKTRKNFRRLRGHRQPFTSLRIKEIVVGG